MRCILYIFRYTPTLLTRQLNVYRDFVLKFMVFNFCHLSSLGCMIELPGVTPLKKNYIPSLKNYQTQRVAQLWMVVHTYSPTLPKREIWPDLNAVTVTLSRQNHPNFPGKHCFLNSSTTSGSCSAPFPLNFPEFLEEIYNVEVFLSVAESRVSWSLHVDHLWILVLIWCAVQFPYVFFWQFVSFWPKAVHQFRVLLCNWKNMWEWLHSAHE